MSVINLFGSSSLCGEAFYSKCKNDHEIFKYSRNNKDSVFFDFNDISSFKKLDLDLFKKSYIVSFAPIWLTSKLIDFILNTNKEIFLSIKGIIVCSSSSALTKRFSVNSKDKKLANLLLLEEKKVDLLCSAHKVSCIIIRPTMIYGRVSNKVDGNIFKIFQLTKFMPFIFLPKKTGFRQPIHADQLVNVILFFLKKLHYEKNINCTSTVLEVGGDEALTYKELISRISPYMNHFGFIKKTILISIPDSLFYLLFSPLFLINMSLFESVFRIGADLSGFKTSSSITGKKPVKFPFLRY